jgi:DNA-binding SARP family transcriptional activator/pimeloyl-ACP methyl ester carboxylesterase
MAAVSVTPLRFQLFGALRVLRGGDALLLPASKKTRALLAYLVLTGREHTRDRLCALLFPDVDDPRAALRWSLSRLRPIVGADGRARLVADREVVRFDAGDAEVDALVVRSLLARDPAKVTTEALTGAAEAFEGPLLAGLDLPDAPEFHGWCMAERERFRKIERELLERLVERLQGDPETAVPWAERRARLDPEDDGAHARLVAVLGAAGRTREADAHFRAHRRWLEARGSRPGPRIVRAWAALSSAPAPAPAAESDEAAGQEVRFCRSRDGTSIAYATAGSGPPLVKAAHWLSHLEFEWRSPVWRHWMRELTRDRRLVRHDQRANGLSDWAAEDLSLEAFVDDLDAVVAAAGLRRYPLLGISQGGAIAIAHALRHPESVSALVLYGAYALGWKKRRSRGDAAAREAMLTLMLHGWGRPNAAFRQLFTSLFCPGATLEQMEAFNELQRESASPENAVRLSNAVGEFDVTALLPYVRVPTLVLHARDDAVVPFAEGRRIAVGIPGARFVPLEGRNHILLQEDTGWPAFLAEVRAFLARVERHDAPQPDTPAAPA